MRRLLAVFVVVSLATTGGTVTAEGDVYAIDKGFELGDSAAVGEYETTGNVSAQAPTIEMQVTIADDHDAVGLDGYHADTGTTWLRVDYNETIERTVRFYVPAAYWYPHRKAALNAEDADVTAELVPTASKNYTAVTIEFTGETHAVFPISVAAGTVMQVRDTGRSRLENWTGVDLPSLFGGSAQWQYVPDGALSGSNTTVAVTTDQSLTMQWDRDPGPNATTWVPVPGCDGSSTPVCRFRKAGNDSRVYILSQVDDAPPVRYKDGGDPLSGALSELNSVWAIAERAIADARKLVSGVTG